MKSDGNPTPAMIFLTIRHFGSFSLLGNFSTNKTQFSSTAIKLSNPRNSPIPMEATALKTNMEPENNGFQDEFSFVRVPLLRFHLSFSARGVTS